MRWFLFLLPLAACGVEPEGYEFEDVEAEDLGRYSQCIDGEVPSITNTHAPCWYATYRCGKQPNGSFGCVQSGFSSQPSSIWCVANSECVADDLSDYTSVAGVGDYCQCGSGAPDPDGWTDEDPFQ
jgi:hypothetical protein